MDDDLPPQTGPVSMSTRQIPT